jgi:photosystem II stability/assembly factor-like uncharacterized protein
MPMFYGSLSRAAAIAVAVAVLFLLLFVREATSPSGEGYWPALAPAPGGAVYLADQAHHELLMVTGAGEHRVGNLPNAIYRALAADGATLMLATEGRLYVSADAGQTWRPALRGRFTAVSVRGSMALAGAWDDALWQSEDGGVSWRRAEIPAADTEFEAIVPGYIATLLGLLHSEDGGRSWQRVVGLPNRLTSISETNGLAVGDWRGTVWEMREGSWSPAAHYPGGVSSVAGEVVATTGGLYRSGRRVSGELGSREVSKVVATAGSFFAAAARGPLYFSSDGNSWRVAHQG